MKNRLISVIYILALVVTFASSGSGQTLFSSAKLDGIIKSTIGGGKSERKMFTDTSVYVRVRKNKISVEVYIYKYDSEREAISEYKKTNEGLREQLAGAGKWTPIESLGDNASIVSEVGSKAVGVRFIESKCLVNVNGLPADMALLVSKRFSRALAESCS